MEAGYQSAEFREFCHTLGYRIESSPTRDKHAHGVAERSVGNIVTKANIAMLGNITHPCPQTFWPDAILYACHCDGFGYKNKIGTSPYFYINQRHIHLKYLHHFWTPVYFIVPAHERKQGKLGEARVADGTCIIEKVDSKENNSDIGTKRVPKFIFEYLTHKLVDKSLRTNI